MTTLPHISHRMIKKLSPAAVGGMWSFWRSLSGGAVSAIVAEVARPFAIGIVGTNENIYALEKRLAQEIAVSNEASELAVNSCPYLTHYASLSEIPTETITLNADVLTENEVQLAEALVQVIRDHPALRLALAKHIPAFRPAVATQMIQETAMTNARLAVLSALPGIVPFTDFLLPITAAGDMVSLTRNQVILLLKIAAIYGREVDLRARVRELLPIVGSAFGWRALARELLGLVPGGIGVVIKGAVAYAGTYTVGKGADIYYSTGHALSESRLRQLYKAAFKDALGRIRHQVRHSKEFSDSAPMNVPD